MIAYLHRYFVPHSVEQGYSLAIQVGALGLEECDHIRWWFACCVLAAGCCAEVRCFTFMSWRTRS